MNKSRVNRTTSGVLLSTVMLVLGSTHITSAADVESVAPEKQVVKVSAGASHTCAIDNQGALICWGYNQDGQINVPTNVTDVVDVATGWYHTCALSAEAQVNCWGWNGQKQTDVRTLDDPQSVHAGYTNSCALSSSAVVQCWGATINRNDVGFKPWKGNGSTITQVSLFANHGCVVTADAAVICWGANAAGQADVPGDLGPATAVAVGSNHSCALLENATVRCWGSNAYGQTSVPANLNDVTLVTAGGRHTCAVAGEVVRCWGANDYGQSTTPTGLTDVVGISAGGLHTCAVTSVGALSCWGSAVFKDGSAASAVPAQFLPWPADFPEDTNPAPAGALQLLGNVIVPLGEQTEFFGAYGRAGQSMSIGSTGLSGRTAVGDAFGFARFTSSFTTAGKKNVTLKAKIGSTTKSAAMTVWVPKVPAAAKLRAGRSVSVTISALPAGADVTLTSPTGEEFTATANNAGTAKVVVTLSDKGLVTLEATTDSLVIGRTAVTVS